MKIGFAIRDITPPLGEEMAGYGWYSDRRAQGTADPLCARVCAFADAGRTVVLVQLDLIGLMADFVEELRERLNRAHGLRPEFVLFHCTHTHCGPASFSYFGPGAMTAHIRGVLMKQIGETVSQALEHFVSVVGAKWFDAEFEGIGFNRDLVDGPMDSRIRGLVIECAQSARDGSWVYRDAPVVLVNYACHPVSLGVQPVYSADYPGVVARYLATLGYRCFFLTGPCGDIDPLFSKSETGPGSLDVVRIYGERVGSAVERAIGRAVKVTAEPVSAASAMVDLPVSVPRRGDLQAAVRAARQALEKDPTNGQARVKLDYSLHCLRRLDAGAGSRQPVEANLLRLGDVAILGVSAELFTSLGQIIREKSGLDKLLIAATSNGLVGYIASCGSVKRQGYAATESADFYGIFRHTAGGGEVFAEGVARFVAEGASPRRRTSARRRNQTR